jgi:hypothetical protein
MTDILKERLEQIANTPRTGSATGPDVTAAAARGRRVLRARRAGTAAGTALAVGLAAALVGVGLPEGENDAPAVQPLAGAPRATPLMQRADFGWLPHGYKVMSVGRDVDGQFTIGADTQPGKGDKIMLTVVDGKEPGVAKLPGGRPGNRTKAPDVDGHRAFWTIKPGGPGSDQVPAEFRWEPAPGRWALLSIIEPKLANEATIYRIAKSVTFRETPGPFPFTVRGIPSTLKDCRATINKGNVDVSLWLSPDCSAAGLEISVTKAKPLSTYEKLSVVGKKGVSLKPNTTIDGHPAYDRSRDAAASGKGSFIWVFGVDGYDVRLDASAEVLNELKASGGLVGLFHRMTFLNSGHWTAEVFR